MPKAHKLLQKWSRKCKRRRKKLCRTRESFLRTAMQSRRLSRQLRTQLHKMLEMHKRQSTSRVGTPGRACHKRSVKKLTRSRTKWTLLSKKCKLHPTSSSREEKLTRQSYLWPAAKFTLGFKGRRRTIPCSLRRWKHVYKTVFRRLRFAEQVSQSRKLSPESNWRQNHKG